jgi:hypothetical protein
VSQSSANEVNTALDHLRAAVIASGGTLAFPWTNNDHLLSTIDEIQVGPAPFSTHEFVYNGPMPPGQPPKWMLQRYQLICRDSREVLGQQLGTPAFKKEFTPRPYRRFRRTSSGKYIRVYSNFMSAEWAWEHAVSYLTLLTFDNSKETSPGHYC